MKYVISIKKQRYLLYASAFAAQITPRLGIECTGTRYDIQSCVRADTWASPSAVT